MAAAPISIKLRCASWQQLASIYKRDLSRNAIFLKSATPPPLGTQVRIDLTLPSESMVVLSGTIAKHIAEGELDGRGPGVDVRLNTIPQSAMWLIETALASADKKTGSTQAIPQTGPSGATGAIPAIQVQGRAATPPLGTPRPQAVPARAPSEVDAALGDGSDLAAAETELIVALTSELDSLKRLNPFQVLGLGYEANDADVRAAFGELTKRYHPDRYARFASPDLKNLAAEIFILIRDAYRRLGDEQARQQVINQLGPRRSAPAAAGKTPPPVPRASTMQGAGPPPLPPAPREPARPATPPPRPATPPPVARVPEPPPPPAPPAPPPPTTSTPGDGLAMAESMLDAGKYDEGLAYYKLLVKKNPNDRLAKAGIELAEGMRAMASRDRLEAAQRFEAVLELDPANERAARELAEMRRLATNERKGMLSRLLGKKE